MDLSSPQPLTPEGLKLLILSKGFPSPRPLFLTKTWLVPSPDFEYFAVVAFPPEEWMKLQTPKDKHATTCIFDSPKIRVDEIYKFCDLLFKGDTTVVECLYLTDTIFEDQAWKELQSMRSKLARTRCVASKYLGQPKMLLHYSATRPGSVKLNLVDVFRWLYEARRLIEGGELRPTAGQSGDSPEDTFLRSLRRTLTPAEEEELRAMAANMLKHLDTLFADKAVLDRTLPNQVDKEMLNQWMVRVRRAMLLEPAR